MRPNTKGVTSVGGSGELELSPAVSGDDGVGIGKCCTPKDGVAADGGWVVGGNVGVYAVLAPDAECLASCARSLTADAGSLTAGLASVAGLLCLVGLSAGLALVVVPVSGAGYVAHVCGGV